MTTVEQYAERVQTALDGGAYEGAQALAVLASARATADLNETVQRFGDLMPVEMEVHH
jgi:hypothetical protein